MRHKLARLCIVAPRERDELDTYLARLLGYAQNGQFKEARRLHL